MNITRKDATIANTDDDFPGAFEVVLSTATKDRDGDELAPEDWQQPLPGHITFDVDHGMSVEKTIGSGVPSIEDGKLVVRGTYSSLPRAQEVRTLVKEGHIRTTSVAFSSKKSTKDGTTRTTRELLNGAFVAIPANTEAVVLSAKAGARNSTADQTNLQAAHDAVVAVGAVCAGPEDSSGADEDSTGGKSLDEQVAPVKPVHTKAMDDASDPGVLAQGVDAALDQACALLADVDLSTLPEPVAQAIGLVTSAAATVDELLDALGVDDPDETDEETTPNAEKSADADALELQLLALRVIAAAHHG